MKATFASAQIRCSGSARRASSCSATSLTRSWNADADARLERGLQSITERAANVLRADQIKLRRLGPLWRLELDRIELGVVQGQTGTFARRSLVDLVDRFAQRAVELLVALLGAEVRQRARG